MLHNNKTEVHLYQLFLPDYLSYLKYSNLLLSNGEKERASRFINSIDKTRFQIVHILKRKILGRYLDISPVELQFEQTEFGKPYLKMIDNQLYFNISYRGNYALIGVSNNKDFGVDIEQRSSVINKVFFISTYFCNEEIHKINSANRLESDNLIFKLWSMKEAYIKAIGSGLTKPINTYNILPYLSKTTLYPDFDSKNAWHIEHWQTEADYFSSFAVKSNCIKLKRCKYEE